MNDDVMIWKCLVHCWYSVRGINWLRVDSSHKGQQCWIFMFFLLLALTRCHTHNQHSFDVTVMNEYFIFLFLHVCVLSTPCRISTRLVALHQGQFKVTKTTPTPACLLSSESTPHYARANKNTLLMLHLTLLILPLWGHKQKGWRVEGGGWRQVSWSQNSPGNMFTHTNNQILLSPWTKWLPFCRLPFQAHFL